MIDGSTLGWGTSTALHDERLDAVAEHLLGGTADLLLDLGCGSGALIERLLLESSVRRVVGVDNSPFALYAARRRLDTPRNSGRWTLRAGSITDAQKGLPAVDAVALVETIEHLNPSHLSQLERAVFALHPALIAITTPNREYNRLYGLAPGEYRHPHHRFEWERGRFEAWAAGVAVRNGYDVQFEGIGPAHAWYGTPTQMAIFRRPML
ncbi:MAG: methyltransferase domain-containing protein [Gemmatimonadetes bacterium]|nr:methyltransferase domain-containing protein [Gemmatimonadota bacterium]